MARRPVLAALLVLLSGCQTEDVVGVILVCEPGLDRDGDGVADRIEEGVDTDGDRANDDGDTDSDGDGLPDADEARSEDPCAPADTDGDGVPDFRDTDSDGEGLSDADEASLCTDPADADTDDDGVSDFVELTATSTDPCDATDTLAPGDAVVVLPFGGDPQLRRFTFGTRVRMIDVYFLADTTASMAEERTALRTAVIDELVVSIGATVPDFQVGVGIVADYPVGDYGETELPPGADSPYLPMLEITQPHADRGYHTVQADITGCARPGSTLPGTVGAIVGTPNGREDLLEAMERLPCERGGDDPDAYVAALFAVATGRALPWPAGTDGMRSWDAGQVPMHSCPTVPGELRQRVGFPCFRPDALPIVVLAGDAAFHDGPGAAFAYDRALVPDARTYDEAVTALGGIGARVVAVFSGTETADSATRRAGFEAVARDTGTVLPDGAPLVADVAGDGSGYEVAIDRAVRDVVERTPADVTAEVRDPGAAAGRFDPIAFVRAIEAVEGYRDGVPGADPGTSYRDHDATTFHDVVPGTTVVFEIELSNGSRETTTTEVYVLDVVAVGNGVAALDTHHLYVVVPPIS